MSDSDSTTPTPAPTPAPPGVQQTVMVPDPSAGRPAPGSEDRAAAEFLRDRAEGASYRQPESYSPDDYREPDERDFQDRSLHFKNEDEAFQHRKDRAAEQAQSDAEFGRYRQALADQQHEAHIRAQYDYTPVEGQIVEVLRGRAQTNHAAAVALVAELPAIHERVRQVAAHNPVLAQSMLQQVQASAAAILAEDAFLAKGETAARQTVGQFPVRADRVRLEKLHPELRDPAWKEGAIKWAMDVHGVTREEAGNATDLGTVSRFVRGYKQHLADERKAAFGSHLKQWSKDRGTGWRQGGIDSLEGLRQEMIRTGSQQDAETYHIAKQKYRIAVKQGRL
jgi:hypothetical protein